MSEALHRSLSRSAPDSRRAATERNPTPDGRLDVASDGLDATYGPTEMHRQMLEVGRAELAPMRVELDALAATVQELEATGGPPVGGGG